MEYRECREKAFFDIISCIQPDICRWKSFLLLGGIRAGLYIYMKSNLPFFIPTGFSKIHYPYILEQYKVEWERVKISELIRKSESDICYQNDNVFILIFNDSMLRTREYEDISFGMFGDSQLTIKKIDLIHNKIVLNHENEQKYWIDIKLYEKIERDSMSIANDIAIYRIGKQSLRNNKDLVRYINQDPCKLLYNMANIFLLDKSEIVKKGLLRLDGKIAYDYLATQLLELKKTYLQSRKYEQKQYIEQYIFALVIQYKKFITVGSDANYRNEFVDILQAVEIDLVPYVAEWKDIALSWTKLTIELTKLLKSKDNSHIEILDLLLEFHKIIGKREFETMTQLRNRLSREC